jgi:hypothetical protein
MVVLCRAGARAFGECSFIGQRHYTGFSGEILGRSPAPSAMLGCRPEASSCRSPPLTRSGWSTQSVSHGIIGSDTGAD